MSDGSALLAAILEQPGEDTPRLVYADWLEELAESLPPHQREPVSARAEFIRVQVEIANTRPNLFNVGDLVTRSALDGSARLYEPGDTSPTSVVSKPVKNPRLVALKTREAELFATVRQMPFYVVGGTRYYATQLREWWGKPAQWVRGFVENVGPYPWGQWALHAPEILKRQPIRRVTLSDIPRVEYASPHKRFPQMRLVGGEKCLDKPPGAIEGAANALALLALEYPGVTFDLPAGAVA